MDFERFTSSLNRKLDPVVKTHLKNVYSTLTMSILSASLGGYVHLYTNLAQTIGTFFNFIISAGLMYSLYSTPHNEKNLNKRLGYLLGFAFFTGFGMGPLVEVTLHINPNILPTAFLSTSLIFACFTLSSLFGDRRQSLYLGGTVMSGLTLMSMISIMNLFFQSYTMYKAYLYLGFAVMCGFVIYDTALIIEKRLRGETDYISHAMILFIDFASIFRKILVLLADKERNQNKRNKRN